MSRARPHTPPPFPPFPRAPPPVLSFQPPFPHIPPFPPLPPQVHLLVDADCRSPGDALRFVYGRDCVKGDCVIVPGDVVANVNLAPALAAHRRRHAADKNAILTLASGKGGDGGEAMAKRVAMWGLEGTGALGGRAARVRGRAEELPQRL